MKKEKMNVSSIIAMSLMLFAMFFGAGNMIFPPALGQLAGTHFISGLAGFMVTDIGISVLAIMAVAFAGETLDDMARRINPKFSVFATIVIYLLIGPLFALPRTGTVSYELALLPFLKEQAGHNLLMSIIFTFLFFAATFLLALNPHKIVDIIGKILTPFLLIAIGIMFVGVLVHPIGGIGEPAGSYEDIPFFQGMLEGYLALDGLAALVFASIVIDALKDKGISQRTKIVKYTLLTGFFAAIALCIVYMALGYIGAVSGNLGGFENGGRLLSAVTHLLFGKWGNLVLGVAVLVACLTTSIGLTSSFGKYFHSLLPRCSYRRITFVVCLFSFVISNVGLTALIKITMPALIVVYPVAVTLTVVSFFHKWFRGKTEVYIFGMLFAFAVSLVDGLDKAHIVLGVITKGVRMLPAYDLGVAWVLPALIGCGVGLLPFVKFMGKKGLERL